MPTLSIGSLVSRLVSEPGVRVTHGLAYGGAPRQRLDVFEPPYCADRAPICVFFYGGTWQTGERSLYAFVGAALASQGIVTVIPDYRLYPDVSYPTFMEDAARAVAFAADRYGPAGSRPIILAGHSAGAHIAALLALDPRYRDDAGNPGCIAALIGLSGPYAFEPTIWAPTAAIFARARDKDEPRPVAHVSGSSPPALLMHGSADRLVMPSNLHEMAAAYRRHGRPVKAIELAGLNHVDPLFAIARPLRWRAPVLPEILAFVRTHGAPATALPVP